MQDNTLIIIKNRKNIRQNPGICIYNGCPFLFRNSYLQLIRKSHLNMLHNAPVEHCAAEAFILHRAILVTRVYDTRAK